MDFGFIWTGDQKSEKVPRNLFVECSKSIIAVSGSVVIKFKRLREQFYREREVRQKGDLNDNTLAMSLPPGPSGVKFARYASALISIYTGWALRDYRQGIIMPATEGSLDAIFRSERPADQAISGQ